MGIVLEDAITVTENKTHTLECADHYKSQKITYDDIEGFVTERQCYLTGGSMKNDHCDSINNNCVRDKKKGNTLSRCSSNRPNVRLLFDAGKQRGCFSHETDCRRDRPLPQTL